MFDLEAFKAGQNALDREGNEWRYVGKLMPENLDYPIVAQRLTSNSRLETFTSNGTKLLKTTTDIDLVSMVSRHTELKKTYVKGDFWQFRYSSHDQWRVCVQIPIWDEKAEYRIHPLNEFIKAHEAGETVKYLGDVVSDNFQWDSYGLSLEDFTIVQTPKTQIVYEWMWKNSSGDWSISDSLKTEHKAHIIYGKKLHKKTGRSWEVKV